MKALALVESPNHVCCRYRIRPFASSLRERGWDLEIRSVPRNLPGLLVQLASVRHYDSVILQRRLLPGWQFAILRRFSPRLIFDFDDAIFHRDSYHRKGIHSPARQRQFARTVRAADAVIAGNNFLTEPALRAGAQVAAIKTIPTCVDASRYPEKEVGETGPLRLVWIGSASTLQGLEQSRAIWERLGRDIPDIKMIVIADRFPRFESLPVVSATWNEIDEARQLAAGDIGISWIPDDDWSRGKCGLKILQYQAAGLPVVANPVGIHPELVNHEVSGFLASTEDEWLNAVRSLLEPKLRREMGSRGRRSVEARFSPSRWTSAFADIVTGERRRISGSDIANIEQGSASDALDTIRLIGKVFDEYGFVFNARTELPDLFNFDRHYAPPAGGFFVIRNNGRVAASIGVERNGDATAELHRLYVDPEFRSLGWGRALVERTLQWCRNNGIRHIFLWSDTRLDFAHMLYTSMGFTRTDRRPIPKDINNTWEYRFDREI